MNLDSMLVALVKIRGTRTFLYNVFTNESLSLEKKEKVGVAGNNPDEWKGTYLVNSEGQFFINDSYIFGTMREAAKYTKSGRASIQSKVAATLQVLTDEILVNRFFPLNGLTSDNNQSVYLDVRSVKNPTTKGRNIRYRVALSPGWEASFVIMWDASVVSRQQIQSVLIDAGMLVGIGDGRGIGFGRFEVIDNHIMRFSEYKEEMMKLASEKSSV